MNTWSVAFPSPLKSIDTTGAATGTDSEVTAGTGLPVTLVRTTRYSYTHLPAAGEPGCDWNTRDWRNPFPRYGVARSLTVTVHEVLKTQLICGALTFTRLSACAAASVAASVAARVRSSACGCRMAGW